LPLVASRCLLQTSAFLQRAEHPSRQIFAAIKLRRFGYHLEVPHAFHGEKLSVGHWLEEIRARQMQTHALAAGNDGKIKLLRVDPELVPAKLDEFLAAGKEVLP